MHATRRSLPVPPRGRPATVSVPGNVLDGLARATLEATAALVLVCDGAGRIMLANPALQHFTGRSQAELVGVPLWDVVVLPQEAELARAAVAEQMTGVRRIPTEVDWLAAGGVPRRVELQSSVLTREDGESYAVAFVGIDVTVHREREEAALRQATTDGLTGVGNRTALFGALTAALDPDGGAGCGLLFCDLDGFKAVNDQHGHATGDRLLVAVARRLRALAGPDALVARLGGDEFVVLSTGTAPMAVLAGRVERSMRQPFSVAGVRIRIGASIGTAVGEPGEHPDDVVNRADVAMYGEKSVRRARAHPRP